MFIKSYNRGIQKRLFLLEHQNWKQYEKEISSVTSFWEKCKSYFHVSKVQNDRSNKYQLWVEHVNFWKKGKMNWSKEKIALVIHEALLIELFLISRKVLNV